MMFNAGVDHAFSFLNHDSCEFHAAGTQFEVCENSPEGAACIKVTTPSPCVHVKNIDKKCFALITSQRCADHLILSYDLASDAWDLHIFELTRTINAKRWEEKVVPQFKGALVNAYALLGILHIDDIRNIYVHCGYRVKKLAPDSSLVEKKLLLGEGKQPMDWLERPLTSEYLPGRTLINIAIQLDVNGEGEFNLS